MVDGRAHLSFMIVYNPGVSLVETFFDKDDYENAETSSAPLLRDIKAVLPYRYTGNRCG